MSPEKASVHKVCQGCSATLVTPLFCFLCERIQRQKSHSDFFEIFGLPQKYEIDFQKLEEGYQQLVVELHPDFFASASKIDKLQSQESSALLNKAYNTIKSSTERAVYLLDLLTDGEKLNERLLPDGFLQEMFLLQESLEELLEDDSKVDEVKALQGDIQKRSRQSHEAMAELFSCLEDMNAEKGKKYEKIQIHLNVGRYLQRLLDRVSRSEVL